MSLADGELIFNTKVDSTGFNKGTRRLNSSISGLDKAFTKLGLTIGAVFGAGKIIGFVKDSIKATTDLENATMGLQSIVEGTGKDFAKAQEFIKSYTKDGLIPATDAITAYKNLALRGYDDSQIQSVMKALKDSAAFGRQASYSMGEAVRSATEGLKNENSILVDNAGVTKNVAKMWDEYAQSIGTTSNRLTQQQKIQAEVAGILKETQFQMGDAAKVADSYSGRMLQLSYNLNNLKIAIGNIVRPIVSALIPVINAAIIALTKFFNMLGAKMTASTIQINANAAKETKNYLDGATSSQKALGNATKKTGKEANKVMASFDEIQKLTQNTSDNSDGNGAGGSTAGGGIGDMTSEMVQAGEEVGALSDEMTEKLQRIAVLAGIIGGAFLAWRIADAVMDTITNIRRALDEMPKAKKITMGIFLVIAGAALEIDAIRDIIQNGLNAINFAEILAGASIFIMGGYMIGSAFGKAALGGAIAGILAGVGLLFAGLYAAITSPEGINMLSSALITVGTTVIAVSLAVLTGGVSVAIAALVGIVIGALISAGIWIGQHWDEIKAKFFDFIEGIKTKASDLYEKYLKPVIDNIQNAVEWLWTNHIEPLKNKFADFVNFLKEEGERVKTTIIEPLKEKITEIIEAIAEKIKWIWETILSPVIDFLKNIFLENIVNIVNTIVNIVMSIAGTIADIIGGIITTIKGIIEFIVGVFTGDWQHAWQGIVDIFTGIFEAIIGVVKGVLNIVIDIINAMIGAVETAINAVVGALNKIHFDVPDWVPGIGGTSFGLNIPTVALKRIPKLATGTVVPANYGNFLAMLGDNKRETEVVSPLSTMKQALIEALQESGGQNVVINFEESSIGDLVRLLKPYIDKENRRKGASMQVGGAY